MELHNFYGFLTPGGYSCFCSSIPSPLGSRAKESSGIGRERSFLINKPSGKAYLGQGSGRNKISKFLVKEDVVALPVPLAQGRGPRGAQSGAGTSRVGLLHPQPVFQSLWCGCELWLSALLGSTAKGDSIGATQASQCTEMGPQFAGKGGRTSSQAVSREQGSPKHEVGASHGPCENAVSSSFPGLVAKGSSKFRGWILCWNRSVTAEAQSPGCTEDVTVCGAFSHCTPAWQGTTRAKG